MMVAIIVQKVKNLLDSHLLLWWWYSSSYQISLFLSHWFFFKVQVQMSHTQYCWECHRPPKVRNHLSLKCLFVWRRKRRKILYEFSQQKPREEHVCLGFFSRLSYLITKKNEKKGFYFLKLSYQDYLLLLNK